MTGKVFVELQANASLEKKNLSDLPCVQLSILCLENENDCFSLRYKNYSKYFSTKPR